MLARERPVPKTCTLCNLERFEAAGQFVVSSETDQADGLSVAGYLRVAARPDFQGGIGQLGYWNLYGRLLNEGPYLALELKLNLLKPDRLGDRLSQQSKALPF